MPKILVRITIQSLFCCVAPLPCIAQVWLFALFFQHTCRQGVWRGCQQVPLIDEAGTGAIEVNPIENIFEQVVGPVFLNHDRDYPH